MVGFVGEDGKSGDNGSAGAGAVQAWLPAGLKFTDTLKKL
jgi:hypothetical protein